MRVKHVIAFVAAVMLCGLTIAAEGVIPRRLAEAKAGEWVLLRDVSGENAGETIKFTVVEIKDGEDKVVSMRSERYGEDGTVIETKDFEFPLSKYLERTEKLEDKAKQIGRERLTVKDKEIAVTAVSWDDEEETREYKLWISEDIPVGGIVKTWSSDPDFPAAELIDFGF